MIPACNLQSRFKQAFALKLPAALLCITFFWMRIMWLSIILSGLFHVLQHTCRWSIIVWWREVNLFHPKSWRLSGPGTFQLGIFWRCTVTSSLAVLNMTDVLFPSLFSLLTSAVLHFCCDQLGCQIGHFRSWSILLH